MKWIIPFLNHRTFPFDFAIGYLFHIIINSLSDALQGHQSNLHLLMSCSVSKLGYSRKWRSGKSHSLCLILELSPPLTFSLWVFFYWILPHSVTLNYNLFPDDNIFIFQWNGQYLSDLQILLDIVRTQYLQKLETIACSATVGRSKIEGKSTETTLTFISHCYLA